MDQHVWKKSLRLNNHLHPTQKLKREYILSGESQASLRTGFRMGSFCLDAGHSIIGKWSVLLISHTHADHIFSLTSFLLAPGEGHVVLNDQLVNRLIIVPDNLTARNIKEYISSFCRLVGHPLPRIVVTVITDNITISIKGLRYNIKTLDLHHNRHSVAYLVSIMVSDVNRCWKLYPQFAYVTDTSQAFEVALLEGFPVVIMECTFFRSDEEQMAHDKTHIHWNWARNLAERYQNTLWVLVHHTKNMKNEEYPQPLHNIIIWGNPGQPPILPIETVL
jgi:ribonuclease BN (tRNA processing enzyme)